MPHPPWVTTPVLGGSGDGARVQSGSTERDLGRQPEEQKKTQSRRDCLLTQINPYFDMSLKGTFVKGLEKELSKEGR